MRLGRGLNIGGWISQSNLTTSHIKSFFVEEDAKRIASWGFENIRLPFDYPLLENDEHPGEYSEEGFEWLDRGIEWGRKAGLSVVLDMHHAPGFTFNNPDDIKLITDPSCQKRFFDLWKAICKRYSSIRDGLYFELLNEIVVPNSAMWNELAAKAVSEVRTVDETRVVVVGSNRWNSASTFPELDVIDDPNIIYTFHFYEPFTFTHQKAGWNAPLRFHGLDVPYPGKPPALDERARQAEAEGLTDVARELRSWARRYDNYEHNHETLVENLAPVLQWVTDHPGLPVYCGEFGVIDTAPVPDRIRWHRDMVSLLNENGIDWSLWSYKGMNFGVVDRAGRVVSEELLEVISR